MKKIIFAAAMVLMCAGNVVFAQVKKSERGRLNKMLLRKLNV
jgi:hypothetical protein